MTRHGIDYYHIIKHYMDNLSRGVFPMWDPFYSWGRLDNIDLRFIGEFNPFLWVYAALSHTSLSPMSSFAVYSTSYYFLGLFGFYLLAKKFLGRVDLAVISFTLLLFSSLTFTIFNNYCILLLFVPSVWFFYFLAVFMGSPEKKYLLGLTFSLMIVTTTYMPFYFVTISAAVFLVFVLLFFPEIKRQLPKVSAFLRKNKALSIFCIASILASLIPGLLWYWEGFKGDQILSWRHEGAGDAHTASMDIDTINTGSIIGPVTFKWLFSELAFPDQTLFYMSVFIFIILLLSMVNYLNRRLLALFISGFIVLLVMLTDATPAHRFLYDHIYFFKLFRNIFYLLYLCFPILILFCVEQLRIFLEHDPRSTRKKNILLGFITLVHLFLIVFLFRQGDIVMASYAAVVLSFVFFFAHFSGLFKGRKILPCFLLLVVVLIQPVEVFSHYIKNKSGVVAWFPVDRFYPKFSFIRPARENDSYFKGRSPKEMQDGSGFDGTKYTGLSYPYVLQKNIKYDVFENYARNKFIVYDTVEHVDTSDIDFKRMEEVFRAERNLAFIFDDVNDFSAAGLSKHPADQFEKIAQNSPQLTVLDFDLNKIKFRTNFSETKFLVYNDSFHNEWKCFMDNQKIDIHRANFAFKGIWIPAGEHIVYFHFGVAWRYWLSYFLLAFYALFFVFVIYLFIKQDQKQYV